MSLLEKVISTTSIGADSTHGGGFLNAQQSGQFIDYMWDNTTLASQVRTVPMNADQVDLDRISVGERLMRLATEAVDDGVNAAVAFTKVSLVSTKLRMDWELSSEALEDGLEGDALDGHIARLMAQQASSDLEDLAINGDTIEHSEDALLKSFDGWRKRLYYGGHVLDASTITQPDGTADSTLHRGVFNAALRAMPRRFMDRRGSLKFFTATGLIQDYLYRSQFVESSQGGFATGDGAQPENPNANPGGAAGWSPAAPYGVSLSEVPLFPEYTVGTNQASDLWLVDPKNLVWGVRRQVQVFREFKPKKDTFEYTSFIRCAANVENPQACVIVKGVTYRD